MHWDVFCRVVDNWGDAGVCWRLAADLASRGDAVRLWIDDPAPLAWMAPGGHPAVEVIRWDDAAPDLAPHEVVVEAFGCDPPARFVERMTERPAVWINLEYLSAEPYAEASHALPSPQRAGPTKWFFFPGFSERSGGLLREPGLLDARAAFERDAWLARQGIVRGADERVVVLFCYANPALPRLVEWLADEPTLLLVTQGAAASQLPPGRRGALRAAHLPLLSQADFDRLLWSADVNFVRGEDSLVRAIWAGAPFVWHIYPQHDGVHEGKLDALLERMQAPAPLRDTWRWWNGFAAEPAALPDAVAWRTLTERWRDGLASQPDLTTRLRALAASKQ
jgi:uncharacterized repeat protein (TIGR03837 family)